MYILYYATRSGIGVLALLILGLLTLLIFGLLALLLLGFLALQRYLTYTKGIFSMGENRLEKLGSTGYVSRFQPP